jgi:hypothetical protein
MARDTRNERFTLLCNNNERYLIAAIAHYPERTQADALRFLIRVTAQKLGLGIDQQVRDSQKSLEGNQHE